MATKTMKKKQQTKRKMRKTLKGKKKMGGNVFSTALVPLGLLGLQKLMQPKQSSYKKKRFTRR